LAKDKTSKKPGRDHGRNSGRGWLAFASIIDTLIDKFGWPGMLVVFVMYMIVYHATEEQRHALIDMYLLGRGIGSVYPITVMGLLFISVLFSQRHYFKKKEKLMQAELARIGTQKSAQQEQAMGTPLHHSPAAAAEGKG
jgi:hypothetical protein